jgi:DNA polymerase-1
MNIDKTIVLIDANNTLYRMFHTKPPKEFMGQRYESAMALLNEVKSIKNSPIVNINGSPEVIVICDAPGKNFRHDFFPEYKLGRKGMPPELKSQENLAHNLLKASGIPCIEQAGIEADDLIGILAKHYESLGFKIVIWANDKDVYQLINENITLFNTDSKKIMDIESTTDKFGVSPKLISSLLAIMGDDKDGIPGLNGIGIKTAAKWLNSFGSIDEIMNNAQNIPGKAGESLKSNIDILPRNLFLTTLRTDFKYLDSLLLQEISNSKANHTELSNLYALCGMKHSHPKEATLTKESMKPIEPNPIQQGMLF